MILFLISILAGILTILAPCVLPILPIVVGSSDLKHKGINKKALTVILSLCVSVILFTLLLKASTLFIDIPEVFWPYFSGGIIFLLGLFILFPSSWNRISFIQKLNIDSNKTLGEGYNQKSFYGDILIGFSLGPVFTTCSPTYFFILGTVLPASFILGMFYLFGFALGLGITLGLVAYLGNKLINKITRNEKPLERIKKFFAGLFIITGIFIITGYDKKISTYLLDRGYGGTIFFEENLLKNFKN